MNSQNEKVKSDLKWLKLAVSNCRADKVILKKFKRIKNTIFYEKTAWNLAYYRSVVLICIGKDAIPCQKALEQLFSDLSYRIFCYSVSRRDLNESDSAILGDHPFVTERNINTSYRLLRFLDEIHQDELVFFFISGGSSALFEIPEKALAFSIYDEWMRVLYYQAIPIDDLNRIRQGFSQVKLGQVMPRIASRHRYAFLISDVVSDDCNIIGSGICSDTVFSEAHLSSAKSYLSTSQFAVFRQIINKKSLKKYAIEQRIFLSRKDLFLNLNSWLINENLYFEGSVSENLKSFKNRIVDLIKCKKAGVYLFLGEIFLDALNHGKGGRCQELVYQIFIDLKNSETGLFHFIALASDGKDGNSDYAGAFLSHQTLQEHRKLGKDTEILFSNASPFLEANQLTVEMTDTVNLNDIYFLRID